jgi:hypothetical protein
MMLTMCEDPVESLARIQAQQRIAMPGEHVVEFPPVRPAAPARRSAAALPLGGYAGDTTRCSRSDSASAVA